MLCVFRQSLRRSPGTVENSWNIYGNVKCNSKTIHDVEFVVMDSKGQAILGRDTALKLGVIKLIHYVT
jgi:hypothetical protein